MAKMRMGIMTMGSPYQGVKFAANREIRLNIVCVIASIHGESRSRPNVLGCFDGGGDLGFRV